MCYIPLTNYLNKWVDESVRHNFDIDTTFLDDFGINLSINT